MKIAAVFAFVLASTALMGAEVNKPSRRVLAADYSKKRIAILDEAGKVRWEHRIDNIHDLHMLPSGNILFQTSMTRLLEVDPKDGNKIVWEYNAAKMNGNEGKRVEVHAFQRLEGGTTMIAESGPARIIEVDAKGGIVRQIKMKVNKPDPHRDTRLVRKLETGNYLVCHEGDGAVREYSPSGEVVWEYVVPMFGKQPQGGHAHEAFGNAVFSALRLPSGNTLIGTGNGHSILEVTPDKQIVWQIHQDDLPGIKLAWVTTLQVLPSGNVIIGKCHAGTQQPQLVEVTRDKKVVWTFKNFDHLGDATSNSQVLDVGGIR